MEKVFSTVKGFLGGMGSLFLAALPVTVLWQVLSGTTVLGMDVISNLTSLVTGLGQSGFIGLVVLVIITSFFVDDKK